VALLLGSLLALSLVCLCLALALARRLVMRLRSLTRPAHELRGALTALQLGLDPADRRNRCTPGFVLRSEGLRAQLERATFALAELDRRRQGKEVAANGAAVDQREAESLDLATIVLRTAGAWSQLAPGYGARLDLDWRAGPVPIDGHAASLRQALDNLIANALEHGGGRVLVEGERLGARARVTISDGGPGPRLHAKSTGASWHSPRGHGLAIASEAIEAHGGSLMSGVGGNGAALVLELPVTTTVRSSSGAGSRAA
jgi:signal transduction histidine kinase